MADPIQPEDPVETFKKYLALAPAAPPPPPPQPQQGVDPAVAQQAQADLMRNASIRSLVSAPSHVPTLFSVLHPNSRPDTPMPAFDQADKGAMLPVQQEQARVATQNANTGQTNTYQQDLAKNSLKQREDVLGAMRSFLQQQTMKDIAGTKANATLGAAGIAAKAKLDAIKAQIDAGTLSPDAIDRFADQLNTTGQMPRIPGRGPAATAQGAKVANTAAQKAAGGAPPLAAAGADYSANKTSLGSAQKLADTTDAQEMTAGKNLDQFLGLVGSVTDTGSPLLNKPARWLDENSGDPNIARFRTARQVAVTEIARVLASGNNGLTDSQRHEVSGLIGENATNQQVAAAAQLLKQDMANRHAAQQQQLSTIKGRIGGQAQPKADPAALEQKARARLAVDPNDKWGNDVLTALGKK